MDKQPSLKIHTTEVFELLAMDKTITVKEVEEFLQDSNSNKNKNFRKNRI